MSKAIETLREHFNQKPVPNSKVLMEERDRVNALIDAVEAENAKLRELVSDMFDEIEVSGFDPIVERHGKGTVYYEEDPSWRVGIRERVRELGIEVES